MSKKLLVFSIVLSLITMLGACQSPSNNQPQEPRSNSSETEEQNRDGVQQDGDDDGDKKRDKRRDDDGDDDGDD